MYTAHDPTLDRHVAIKMLIAPDDPRQREALLKEARTLAQISSPHVIAAYDVVVPDDGPPFVTMELVEGNTLAEWLEAPSRRRTELLSAFADAARGLIAIHDAGLVHQDFKPANVIVGQDDRIRVADFGLARGATGLTRVASSAATSTDGEHEEQPSAGRSMKARGTPAYMAPELWALERASPASDQYAFFVSLFEGLLGRRPYRGRTAHQIVAEQARGDLGDLSSLSPPLRAMLRRGLSAAPADRYHDMRAVLAALERGRGGWWRWGIAGLLGASLGIVAWTATIRDEPCRHAGSAARDDWQAQRPELVERLRGAGPTGPATAQRVVAQLDGYSDELAKHYAATCKAATVDDVLSAEDFDTRVACLDRSRTQRDALVAALIEADPQQVDHVVTATHALAPPKRCTAVGDVTKDATDAALNRRLDQLQARAWLREPRTIADASAIVDEAAATAHVATQVRANLVLSQIAVHSGDSVRSLEACEAAFELASGGGVDSLAAEAAVQIATIAGLEQRDLDRGEQFATLAIRLGRGARPDVIARAQRTLSGIHRRRGEYEDAVDYAELALANLETRMPSQTPEIAVGHAELAIAYWETGKLEDARQEIELAHAGAVEALGELHPTTLRVLNVLSRIQEAAGDLEGSLATTRRVLTFRSEALGDDHVEVARAWERLAVAHTRLQNHELALAAGDRASEVFSTALGADNVEAIEARMWTAGALLELGRSNEALEIVVDGYDAMLRVAPEDDVRVLATAVRLTDYLTQARRDDEALPVADVAVERARRQPKNGNAALAYYLRARLRLATGDTEGALEDALVLRERLSNPLTPVALVGAAERWLETVGIPPLARQ